MNRNRFAVSLLFAMAVLALGSGNELNAVTGGPQEGIKVHGHWTIEIRNPDHSLVKRYEFENSLSIVGREIIVGTLARLYSVGLWRIYIQGTSCASFPGCIIVEPTDDIASGTLFKTLTVDTEKNGSGNRTGVVVTGTARAQATGEITSVSTALKACGASIASPNCVNQSLIWFATLDGFSTTTLVTPISVAAGQTIDVKVTITFS